MSHAPAVPAKLNALVLQLLEKAPQKRPESAAQVRRELERIERGLSVAPTRVTGLRTPTGPVEREHDTHAEDVVHASDRATQMTPPPAAGALRWVGLTVAVVLAVGGGISAAVLTSRQSAAMVEPVVEVVAAPEPVVVPELKVEEVAPAPPPEPVAVSTPARARIHHTAAEVSRKLAALEKRAKAQLSGGDLRNVLKDFRDFANDPACVTLPDACWSELSNYQKLHLR